MAYDDQIPRPGYGLSQIGADPSMGGGLAPYAAPTPNGGAQLPAPPKSPNTAAYNSWWDSIPNGLKAVMDPQGLNNISNQAKSAYGLNTSQNYLPANAAPLVGNEGATGYQARPGVDQRNWNYVDRPSAYEYGGQFGLAQSEAQRYMNQANAAYGQQAAAQQQYMGGMDQGQQSRAQQLQGLQMLQGMANGTGPSAAAIQQAQGLAQARQQQASIAASARGGGGNLAAAQQQAAANAGQIGAQGIQNAALNRAQEQIGAIGQYGQAANQLRASDYAGAQLSAQQQQLYAAQADQNERYRGQVYSQQQQGQQAGEAQNLAREGGERGWNMQQQQINNAQQNAWLSAGLSAAGMAAIALSDQRTKENIVDAGADVDDAMNKLSPYGYDYKAGLGTPGRQVGIMAQHLESSRAGATAVEERGGLKFVKLPQATMLNMAGLARLNQRLRALEEQNARKP